MEPVDTWIDGVQRMLDRWSRANDAPNHGQDEQAGGGKRRGAIGRSPPNPAGASPLTFGRKNGMRPVPKLIRIVVAALALGVCAFIAGVYFGPRIWIAPITLGSSTTIVHVCPPSDQSLYTTRDFSRANEAVDEFLRGKREENKYAKLVLKYFVVPDGDGYSTYWYSGPGQAEFPADLKNEADKVVDRALNHHQAEHAAPHNP